MRDEFSVRPGQVLFSSGQPGNYASMFGPCGKKLEYLESASVFDDSRSRYTWGFAHVEHLREGETLVFATADRVVAGEVRNGVLRVVDRVFFAARTEYGGPIAVAEAPSAIAAAPVEEAPRPAAVMFTSSPHASISRSPKVSVVTCSYNRPDLLRAAVESLRAQTDPDWEHLIYDDASTDHRVDRVLEWAREDPRVRVWRGKRNFDRPALLWNFLMDRARGRYLTNLDDDNEKLPRFVEVMSGELDADPSLDIVTCGWVVKRDSRPDDDYFLNLSTSTERLDHGSTCDGGAMLYRRETFDRAGYFSEDLRTNEDWDWLRRAAHTSKIKNLHACHATYRSHDANRMIRGDALGSDADVVRLRGRPLARTLGVRAVRPLSSRLTRSQEDAVQSIERALWAIPWVELGDDLALVISPFQMSDAEISSEVCRCSRVVSIHMEDPYALSANLDRVRALPSGSWVCTNDVATVKYYREVVGDRVFVCPSLGADLTVPVPSVERDIDVLICGYAYPSRRRFMDEFLPRVRDLRVALVGDGWEGTRGPVEVLPTQGLAETYALHARARAVVCLHRTHGDCSDGPVEPATVNRGFLEGRSGARVFLDDSRAHHALDAGDVVWFHAPWDLTAKLRAYLSGPRDSAADIFAEKCATTHSYQARVTRILNCVRGDRHLAEIP